MSTILSHCLSIFGKCFSLRRSCLAAVVLLPAMLSTGAASRIGRGRLGGRQLGDDQSMDERDRIVGLCSLRESAEHRPCTTSP